MSFAQVAAGESARDVRITADLATVVNTMRGGIGASWHAIEGPLPYEPGRSAGGSAWGGHPPASDMAAWRQIEAHADWLGLDWCRVEVEQRMYEPKRGQFDWDNAEMRILYRILDWCQRRGADVFFQQMWSNVDWNAFPEFRDDPVRRLQSGPLSMDDFAEGLASLMEHLIKRKGYTCIRWLVITNEPPKPGRKTGGWWRQPPDTAMPLKPGLAAVRKALDRRGLSLPLAGPDWNHIPQLVENQIDFDPLIGAYDLHTYTASFDWEPKTGFLPLSVVLEDWLPGWTRWAHARNKPFFLGELGTMAYGWKTNHPGPGTYEAGLKDAELVVRSMNLGVDGFNRWSFVNRGDLDGHWQLIDTWDEERKRIRKKFRPHPNTYYLYGLLSRFTAKYSTVVKSEVYGGRIDPHQRVFAAALRSPGNDFTLLVVNDAPQPWPASFELRGLSPERRLHRYRMTARERDRNDVKIEAEAEFPGGGFRDSIPPQSVSIYTTYKRAHHQPGIIGQ